MKLSLLWRPWRKKPDKWDLWWQTQYDALRSGKEIEPPWIAFPGAETWDFNQGDAEAWHRRVWVPFYQKLSEEEQVAYLDKWNAPPEWRSILLKR